MAEEINKTYTSNSLYNDSTGVIAFAEQLKQELINWANYQHVTEELGQNRPDLQNELNNLFLSVYERFLTFLNDADASEEAINTWKEIENFLADYTDEKTLASIVAELNNKIESRLAVPLENTTGSSTTSTMTQKAITETINASKTFTTGEKVDNVGIDSEPTAGSDNLVKSGGVADVVQELQTEIGWHNIQTNNNTYVPLKLKQGKTYRVKNNGAAGSASTDVYFRVEQSGTGQQSVGIIQAGRYKDVVASADFNYIYIYSHSTFSYDISIADLTSLQFQIDGLETSKATKVQVESIANDANTSSSINSAALGYAGRFQFYGIIADNKWLQINSAYKHRIFLVHAGDTVYIKAGSVGSHYAFLKSYSAPVNNTAPDYCSGEEKEIIAANEEATLTAPVDAKFMYILASHNNDTRYLPASLTINGEDVFLQNVLAKIAGQNNAISQIDGRVSTLDGEVVEIDKVINGREYRLVEGYRILSGKWNANVNNSYLIIRVKEGERVVSTKLTHYAWLTEDTTPVAGQTPPFVSGTSIVNNNNDPLDVLVPATAKYLYVIVSYDTNGTRALCYYDNLTIDGEPYDKAGITDIVDSNSPIIIEGVSINRFKVKVYDSVAKKYLTHTFTRQYNTRTYTWDGQSEEKVTSNAWVADSIANEDGNSIVQGNINFINRVYATNEGTYVGEGHGASIAVFTKFYADGVEINPAQANFTKKCNVFKIVEKVNYYAADDRLTANGITYPMIDNNGNFILSSIHFAEATYSINNKISVLNRLTVKRNNTTFAEIFAGMCRVYVPYFNKIYLNDPADTANSFSHDGTNWSFTDIGGSGLLFNETTAIKGSNVIVTGDNYYLKQTICNIGRPFDKNNYRLQAYNDAVKSIKVYQCPAIGSYNAPYIGETAEQFMDGDVLECWIDREIACAPSL